MIFARNNVIVTSSGFSDDLTFLLDSGVQAFKFSVQALSENPVTKQFEYGPVIAQLTEEPQHLFEDELNTSQFLELGFNSRGVVTPLTGIRFRIPTIAEGVAEQKPAKIHLVLYG